MYFLKTLSPSRQDFIWLCVAVFFAFLATLLFDFSDNYVKWAQQYEASELDEIPFMLLITAIATTWYASRRFKETQAEVELRKEAERKASVLLAENKALARHAIQVQEDERRHLYRELHDDLGQYLTAIRLDAVSIPRRGAQAIESHGQRIAAHTEHIQKAFKNIIHRMRPEALDSHGLKEAIRLMVHAWSQLHPHIHFVVHIDSDCQSVGEEVSIVVYRVVQESLTNIAKYAHAKHISIQLSLAHTANPHLQLLVCDDGRGFDCNQLHSAGFGLLSMRERVETLGGRFEIQSTINQGVTVMVSIPVHLSNHLAFKETYET